jgi:hypothetical protein
VKNLDPNIVRILHFATGVACAIACKVFGAGDVAMALCVGFAGVAVKGGILPWVAAAEARASERPPKPPKSTIPPTLLVLLALGGCATAPQLPTALDPTAVRERVTAASDALNLATAYANTAASFASVVCPTATGAAVEACSALKTAHAATTEAIGFGVRAVEAYGALGELGLVTVQSAEALQVATRRAVDAARALATAVELVAAPVTAPAPPPPPPPPSAPAECTAAPC